MNPTTQTTDPSRRRLLRGAILIVAVVALGAAGVHALRKHGHPARPSHEVSARVASVVRASLAEGPIIAAPGLGGTITGAIDVPVDANVVADSIKIAGWAADPAGIRRVDVRVDGHVYVADVHAGNPRYAFEGKLADLPLERHEVSVVAANDLGQRTALGRRSLVSPKTMAMWSGDLVASRSLADNRFYFLMATSGVTRGGAADVETQYSGLVSRTQRIGISVPILYMRETKGAAGDWAFDPAFDLSRKCDDLPVAGDNLDGLIAFAIAKRIPVNFILNGGIWSDASCYSLDWDLTTHLELDPANCQWDQADEVLPGNYRKGLVGSTHSPELSRSLTYNVYNDVVRTYKRRNLQAAAQIVANFARTHPELFAGVTLDADTYMNPFVKGGHHYDYNPGMLRQFREWLAGSGPYAGHPSKGTPDLSFYRRTKPLTLADVNRLARKHWTSWSQVQPPRKLSGEYGVPPKNGETPFWKDAWYQEWDVFRKHIVQLHYAELAEWVHQEGISSSRIYTAQAISPHYPYERPVSTYVTSPSPFSDSAGVSIEGAKPPLGHIGVILYGPSAENAITMEGGHSLFATIGRFDDAWSVAEMNATDLRKPETLPTYAQSYHAFRDAFNYGAHHVSLMAWNGSHGLLAGTPGYVAYTAWRGTPAEQAMMDFLVSHADVPQGALMWTFGSPRLAETDGWIATLGTFDSAHGALVIHPRDNQLVLRSPSDQIVRPATIGKLRLRLEGPARLGEVAIRARVEGDATWHPVGQGRGSSIPFDWPADWIRSHRIVEQLEFMLTFAPGADGSRLTRVLLYPAAD